MGNNQDRPFTTLFLLQSLDGKITTGDNDKLDTDKDFPRITGVKEGLYQYYDIEKQTDRVSFNSGKVMKKVGMNQKVWKKNKHDDLSFVIVDNKPHLDEKGCTYFANRSKTFIVITTNSEHPSFKLKSKFSNMVILHYPKEVDFLNAFRKLKQNHNVDRMTIQTGGILNAHLLRLGLIDVVSIVIAPCLIGGVNTQSLIAGESLHTENDLRKIKALKLIKSEELNNSYLHLRYRVINKTVLERRG